MEGYLMTLIAVALMSGIVGMISPEGDVKKYVRLLCLLCLLCAMIGPALSALTNSEFSVDSLFGETETEEPINYDEIYNNALIAGGEKQAEEAIKLSIIKEFDLPSDSLWITVQSKSKNDTNSLIEVTVTLGGKAIFADPQKIIQQVESMIDCRCIIVYE